MKQKMRKQEKENKWIKHIYWLPIYATLLFLPFITRYCQYVSRYVGQAFYSNNEYSGDSQLFIKQTWFTVIAALLACIIGFVLYKYRKEIFRKYNFEKNGYGEQLKILIPAGVYFVFVLLSSLLSEYKYAAFTGSDDQFESFFVVAGYILLVSYVYFLVRSDEDVSFIVKLIGIAMIMFSVYGILQYTGNDLLKFDWFQKLITPGGNGYIESTMPENTVYLSAYNTNYAGVLLAFLSAFCLAILLTEKKPLYMGLELLLLAALVTCLIGTGSRAGLLVFVVSAGLALLFLLKKLIRYWYVLIPAVTFVVLAASLFIRYQNIPVMDKILNALNLEKNETNPLERLVTTESGIDVIYKDVVFSVDMYIIDGVIDVRASYEDGTELPLVLSEDQTYYTLGCEGLEDVTVSVAVMSQNIPVFIINMNGRDWVFATGMSNVDGCYYLNPYGKLIQLNEVERIGFYGHERFASGRGFLWSQTLPILKDTWLIGSGANAFTFAYPQENYKDMYFYFGGQVLTTRPHCMYLQIAVESGVVSLIALVVFWAWYLLQSVGIYFKSKLETMTERVGFACFLAVFVYLVCGLTNDSMVTVAPVFWCILGLGLATNRMVKEEKKISEMK